MSSKDAYSTASGVDGVSGRGAIRSMPTRAPPGVSAGAKSAAGRSARAAASGAANPGRSSTPGKVSELRVYLEENALRRFSEGEKGWEDIPLADFGCLRIRSRTNLAQTWRRWLHDNSFDWKMPTIKQSVTKVSELQPCDFKYTVGNVTKPCNNQYALWSRSDECGDIGDATERLACHPYVMRLSWGNQKLKNTKVDEHESPWNVRLTTVEGDKAVLGLTRNELGKDSEGRQKTHYWIGQFSGNLNPAKRGRLVDLMLNAAGYTSHFMKKWTPKSTTVARTDMEPVMPDAVSSVNERPPLAPSPERVEPTTTALPLTTVAAPVSMHDMDSPLETEVARSVRTEEENASWVSRCATSLWNLRAAFLKSVASTDDASVVGPDESRESTALRVTPPMARDEKRVSVSGLTNVCLFEVDPALGADVSGGDSKRCESCPRLLYKHIVDIDKMLSEY